MASDVATVRTDIATLDSSAAYQKIRDTLHLDDKGFGDFMGNPVTPDHESRYATDNYGSAVTLFYNESGTVGRRFRANRHLQTLEVDREGIRRITATQAYLSRWLSAGHHRIPAAHHRHPLAIWCSVSNASIRCCSSWPESSVRSSTSTLFTRWPWRSAISAKAIAVILVIVQIPGASGLYPIEMMPNFFRELHPWLRFTTASTRCAARSPALYANHYWLDMLHLFWYLPAALSGLVVRRYAMNLNALFDHRLGGTDPDDHRAQTAW